ncbi:cytidine deaminase [Lachnospiraceae bacterium KH1T2]|nr:cytidine deaminase [Lachnospiraceae bacterium KH1T2]
MTNKELIEKAKEMTKRSYVPYSHFHVGAALLCSDGSVYTGCNIENSAFGVTICAERVAIFKAVSEGKTDFEKIAIMGGRDGVIEDFCPPCGSCRQVMTEFGDLKKFKILLANAEDEIKEYSLEEILPMSFGKERL